ncbi:group II intron reverse transcriptase/maturase [Bacillus alkalicellulosilyticus]|uniref:group II intron reverse transcriptase/maturase n=1 Tax=Alkalihalobacterium alkalicellulosilyticum TaxID=1912214 RepID=UPI001115ECC4|nr:group II intron reverse transcriptase/maturase [Bacillus alkalicellulosilyticus]
MKLLTEKSLSEKKLRHNEYYYMQEHLDSLYERSQRKQKFENLMSLITSRNNILLAYRNIKRNSGSVTSGVDGVSIRDIERIDTEKFVEIIQRKFNCYNPRKVKRVEIPKANGKTRPLGIPSIWDRIVQQCILQILEPICEAKFNKHSYGFRPNRSTEHAIADMAVRINRGFLHYVIDIDIKSFFDEVNHNKLMKQIWTLGIRDKQLLVIIRKILKAPILMPNGKVKYPQKGTPQGGVLSPLLANINLNEMDWWLANQWEERNLAEVTPSFKKSGTRMRGYEYAKMRKTTTLKEFYFVRYADDFKIICRNRKTALKIFIATKLWLKERLNLPISEEKSGITNLKKANSEFLGFSFKAVRKGKMSKGADKYVTRSHVSSKAIKQKRKSLRQQISKVKRANGKEQIEEIIKYNSMVRGIHNYYRLATHCSDDFTRLHKDIHITWYNKLKKQGLTSVGIYEGNSEGIKPYLSSKRLRYLAGTPILPIGFIQHKNPMNLKSAINQFTPSGRKQIHEDLTMVPSWKLRYLWQHPVIGRNNSVEYFDNRISKFVAQKGNCYITNTELEMNKVHCHHIVPYSISKDDSYSNLVIIGDTVHKLIHSTKKETIAKLMEILKLSKEQLDKLNELRSLAGEIKICSE